MKDMIPSLLIVTLRVTFYGSCWFFFLRKLQKNQLGFYFLYNNNSQWNNIFVRCGYSTMNIDIFNRLVHIIIISERSLLCSSIMTILLTLVAIIRLGLIIRQIMFSMWLQIMIWFHFTEPMCLWNFYNNANWWKSTTDCWPITNDFNLFIFNRWFAFMLIILSGRLWCPVRFTFFVVIVVQYP